MALVSGRTTSQGSLGRATLLIIGLIYACAFQVLAQQVGTNALTAGMPVPVVLKIRADDFGAIVSWPATPQNYILQCADQLSSAGWRTATNVPTVVGSEVTVRVLAGIAQQFYRLQEATGTNGVIDAVRVVVNPSAVTLIPGARQTFVAKFSGTQNTGVRWSVEEGVAGGSVDAQGAYTAPAQSGFFHVLATSLEDASKTATVLVFVTDAPTTSDYYPQPLVPGVTTDESKSLTTTVGQPAILGLSDGTRLEIPALSAPVTVTLTRTSNTLDLGAALQHGSGSMRVVTYTGDITPDEFVPLITFPAKEAGSLKAVNIARVGDLTTPDGVLKDQIVFLPAATDASGNLSARDVFLRSSSPSAVSLLRRTKPLGNAATVKVSYSISTYQGNINWSRQSQLVRMIPDATDRTPLSLYPQQAQAEILRKPIQNVVVLVHGHNEAEGIGYGGPEIRGPWWFAYKRDVWHHLYLEFQSKYPEYSDCTAFYEYIYPTFRPVFGGSESLGDDFAQRLAEDPRLKTLKQKFNLFIIAHSMGGLVARSGLNRMDDSIADNFEKLITWGSPHHGSPVVTVRYLLTSGYHLDRPGMCWVASLPNLRMFKYFEDTVQSLAVDTPGERDLRWDNSRPLNLEGAGWSRNKFQEDPIFDPASFWYLYNDELSRFNTQDQFRGTDKYVAFYGITSKTADLEWSCSGLKKFKAAAQIPQGTALIRWIYNNAAVMTGYPNEPAVNKSDGAVPVDSMVGQGIIPISNTVYLGDVDHEEYYGAFGETTARRTFETLNLKNAPAKQCDCPTLTVTQIQRTTPTAQVSGKLVWPGDPVPKQRVLGIAAAQTQANSRTVTAAQNFTVSDDGSFSAIFDVALFDAPSAGQALEIFAQMKDGSEIIAHSLPAMEGNQIKKYFTVGLTNLFLERTCRVAVSADGRLTYPEGSYSSFSTNGSTGVFEISALRIQSTNNVELYFVPKFSQTLITPTGEKPADGNATWQTDTNPGEFWLTTTSKPRLRVGSLDYPLGTTTITVTNRLAFNQMIALVMDCSNSYNQVTTKSTPQGPVYTTNVVTTGNGVAHLYFLKLTVSNF